MLFGTEAERKDFRQCPCFVTVRVNHIDDKIVLAEFPHDLTANTTGRKSAGNDAILAAADRNGHEIPLTIVDCLEEGRALSAVGGAVGCIFDVAALIDRSILAQPRRADLIAGLGNVSMGHGFFGQLNQFFRCHHRISFAKLVPGVSYSTPSSSVTVAAMSAKVARVPRLTGLTFLPSISSGTYSRVWSVVAV